MDLLKTLQQFKNIEPDKNFTRKSRRLLLGEVNISFGIFQNILKTLEVGASVALAGLLIMVVLGGFSYFGTFEPLQITAIDPASIRAEAESIDIQIQLSGFNYSESPLRVAESTAASASAAKDKALPPKEKEELQILSVEEALNLLSQ